MRRNRAVTTSFTILQLVCCNDRVAFTDSMWVKHRIAMSEQRDTFDFTDSDSAMPELASEFIYFA